MLEPAQQTQQQLDERVIGEASVDREHWSAMESNVSTTAVLLIWLAFSICCNLLLAAFFYRYHKRRLAKVSKISHQQLRKLFEDDKNQQLYQDMQEQQQQQQCGNKEEVLIGCIISPDNNSAVGVVHVAQQQQHELQPGANYLLLPDLIQSSLCVVGGLCVLNVSNAWLCPYSCSPQTQRREAWSLSTGYELSWIILALALGRFLVCVPLHAHSAWKNGSSAWNKCRAIYMLVTLVCLFISLVTRENILLSAFILVAECDSALERFLKWIKSKSRSGLTSRLSCLRFTCAVGCVACLAVRLSAAVFLGLASRDNSILSMTGLSLAALCFSVVFYTCMAGLVITRIVSLTNSIWLINQMRDQEPLIVFNNDAAAERATAADMVIHTAAKTTAHAAERTSVAASLSAAAAAVKSRINLDARGIRGLLPVYNRSTSDQHLLSEDIE